MILEAEEAVDLIGRAMVANPHLRWTGEGFDRHPHPLGGFCYVASKAFAHLVPGAETRCVDVTTDDWRQPGRCIVDHFFNLYDENIYDLTADQFPHPVPYDGSRVYRASMDKRTDELLEWIEKNA